MENQENKMFDAQQDTHPQGGGTAGYFNYQLLKSQYENLNKQNNPQYVESRLTNPFYIISEPWEVNQLSQAIMNAIVKPSVTNEGYTPILGVDCEGLSKNRSMQLI